MSIGRTVFFGVRCMSPAREIFPRGTEFSDGVGRRVGIACVPRLLVRVG